MKCKYCKSKSNYIIPECDICETCLINLGVRWDEYIADLSDEYTEILYCLEANLSNAHKYASLCKLSAITSKVDDIEWAE